MDKSIMFSPIMTEAKKIADNYWVDLSEYREKTFNHISELIKANAELGKYQVMCELLKSEKDYIKEKLEDVGYKIELLDHHKDERYIFMQISFK